MIHPAGRPTAAVASAHALDIAADASAAEIIA